MVKGKEFWSKEFRLSFITLNDIVLLVIDAIIVLLVQLMKPRLLEARLRGGGGSMVKIFCDYSEAFFKTYANTLRDSKSLNHHAIERSRIIIDEAQRVSTQYINILDWLSVVGSVLDSRHGKN